LVLALLSAATAIACASAAELPMKAQPVSWAYCQAPDAPYKNYACLDDYLGQDFLTRLINYYRLEWGHDAAPADPKAPPSSRPGWPATPQTTPPMPFTEWPYGGTTSIGVTRPNSVDSPFMNAISNTAFGKFLQDAHIQIYGWVDGGGNLSTNGVRPGGNAPVAYDYTPNTFQFDQGVLFIERLPDTVQTDHIDWGFRFSGLYGQNYRYMTSFGIASYQLLGHNLINGYDFPMEYGELYIPNIGQGLLLRLGRFLSVPDIESQLAPTNYMYSHSLTYWLDNYTNTGLLTTYAVTKNWFLQFGVTAGTDTAPWNIGKRVPNPFPNPVYPGGSMLKDPGAMPSLTGCTRYTTDSGRDSIYLCANAENTGAWGYDNLQWYGGTYYHKFNDQWHISCRILHGGPTQCAEPIRPGRHHRQWRFPILDAEWVRVQRTEHRDLRKPSRARLHGTRVRHRGVPELPDDVVGQYLVPCRVFQRREWPAHGGEDTLCRRGSRLAALVLAAGLYPAGSQRLPSG
jgi:hypothetical protein